MYLLLKTWWFSNVIFVFQGKGINIHPRVNFHPTMIPYLQELQCFLRNFWPPGFGIFCRVLRPPDLFPNLLHHPVLQLDLSHLLCLGFRDHLGGGEMTLVNDWGPLVDILLHIYIYAFASKIPTPVHTYYRILCSWGENQKRVHIPSGWILFRLAYGVHEKNRWNLSFQLALVPEFSMSATSKGSKFDLSPKEKARRLIINDPFRKFMMIVKSLKASKKNLCQLPENLCIPMFWIILDDGGLKKLYQFTGFSCFPAPGNISPATWCLEDENLPFNEMVPFQKAC